MNTLTNLSASLSDTPFTEPQIFVPAIGHEVVPGFRRTARLTPAGLVFTNGETQIAIPMADLWSLADQMVPAIAQPPASLRLLTPPLPLPPPLPPLAARSSTAKAP